MAGRGAGAARRTAAAVLLTAGALLLAACQEGAAAPVTAPAETPAVKVGETPAAATAPAAGPAARGGETRPCRTADLNAAVIGHNGLTGGQQMVSIGIGNRSDTPCALQGPPQLRFLDLQGQELSLTVERGVPCPAGYPCVRQEPVVLAPGLGELVPHGLRPGQAALVLIWSTHDGSGACASAPVRAALVQMALPDGDEIRVAVDLPVAACGGQVRISSFDLVREG